MGHQMLEPEAITSTLEDYLEAISRLVLKNGIARVRDIAQMLSVHKSTVTAALKSLADKGLVNYAPYEMTTLTPRGSELALEVIGRHEVIRRFLADVLRIDKDAADANACRMEHVMDRDVLRRLAQFAERIRTHDQRGHSGD